MSLESLLKSPHLFLKLSFPPVMLELMREAVKPEVNFDRIAQIISLDPVLATTILSLTNSAFYGLPKKVTDLHRAALVLGSREILKIAISVSYQRAMQTTSCQGRYDFFQEWRLTVWSSIAAEMLALRLCPDKANQAYLCSLLKDISLLFLSCSSPEDLPHPETKKHLLDYTPGQLEREEAAWGMHHGALTQLILSRWGIPVAACDSIRSHHAVDVIEESEPLTQALILSTRWAEVELGFSPAQSVVQFEVLMKAVLGLSDQELDDLRQECALKFRTMLQTLGIDERPEQAFYQHSLNLMQNYYFLSLDVSGAEGGAPGAARAIGRHLKLYWDLEFWELALRSPHGEGYHLFRYDREQGELTALAPVTPKELDWTVKRKGLRLLSSDRAWGELRYDRTVLNDADHDRLVLYLRYISQAYERYCGRQAVLEHKAGILDELPIGVARVDAQGRVAEFNRLFSRTAGLSDEDRGLDLAQVLRTRLGLPLGPEWEEFLAAPERPAFSTIACADRREAPTVATDVATGAGIGEGTDRGTGAKADPAQPANCGFYFSARRDHNLPDDGVLILLEDITEISHLELQALRQRDFLAQLVGAMRDVVLTLDQAGVVRFVSQAGFDNLEGGNLFTQAKPTSQMPGPWNADYLLSSRGPVEVLLPTRSRGERPYELIFSRLEAQGEQKQGFLVVGRDLTTIRRMEEHLRRQATYDELTNLFNRYQFQAMLAREIGRGRRTGRPMGIIFFDLDGLKAINDSQGHQAGDAVLRLTGAVLNKEVRTGMDFPCRYGGDEFALIATEIVDEDLKHLAERIRLAVIDQFGGKVTISSGLSMLAAEDSLDTLLARADQAVYRAKALGGNSVVWG